MGRRVPEAELCKGTGTYIEAFWQWTVPCPVCGYKVKVNKSHTLASHRAKVKKRK